MDSETLRRGVSRGDPERNKSSCGAHIHRGVGGIGWGGWIRTNEMAVPKTAALPLGDTPTYDLMVATTRIELVTPAL